MLLIWCLSAETRATNAVRIATPRGAIIDVLAEKPAGKGPFPAVVLASGSSYHMRLPILQRIAQELLARGIAVYRFDWAYQVAGTPFAAQPKDRASEIEDMTTVLAIAQHDANIDRERIAVAGKSLGSIIAWQVLRTTPELRGALLLTPVCTRPEAGDITALNYPNAANETRPIAWILGNSDPACPSATLYRFIAATESPSRLNVLSGDHGFETTAGAAHDTHTVDLAATLSADFLADLLTSTSH